MSFLDELDKTLGIEKKEEKKPEETPYVATPVAEATPDDEFETPTPPDPDAISRPEDPFAAMLDSALQAEGVDVQKELLRRYNPASGDVQTHDWKMHREKLFSGEPYIFRCKRCYKAVHVREDQTINEALREGEIDPNCANVIVTDTMSA